MASTARRISWLRHDAKRKGTPARLEKERARDYVRRLGFKKRGQCYVCRVRGKTVWHHVSYSDKAHVVEICHKCHRREHPRAMPQGGIK